ncbi:hypothetical protein RHSIM_RhsimUnG0179400 [Rhododendron simsii]|uniref:DUF659 domain-containing protein n=1 Tax=Rhododendron simsii TaxID=118357 RepID=A0A834FTT2_RHOSS|nr:hypothetical protein RHSIM_RhsimUnG0179400 [Rhododendron simsii]
MDPGQGMNSEQEILEDDDVEEPSATPLWKYVTKIAGETSSKGGGGGSKFICNFGCKTEPYTGSYSRVRAHLISIKPGQKAQGVQLCPNITNTERELLKQEEMDATRIFGGNAKARKLPSNPSMNTGACQGNQSNNPSQIKGILDDMFKISTKEDVDQRIARCLYGNGIPFNVVRSPLWADMVAAINNAPKGYKSPNYEKDKEQNKVRQALNPLMQDWSTHGVSIMSDGWSNIKNQQLINIMAVSGGKAIFINGHDVSAVEKNATNIAELLFKAIDYVGPSNVVQVVTDNAANCKAAGAIIQRTIKDILSNDPVVCDLIHKRVVARWDKMNIPLHCLAYVLVPKYYTNSWLSNPAPGGVRRRKPHVDSEVQKGYPEAIEKMVVDPNEAAVIRLQISDFVSNKGVFLNLKRLLSRYRDDCENFKNWDANPEEPNIEEDVVAMEERERVSLSDSEDESDSIPVSSQLTIVSSGSAPPCSTSSILGSSSGPSPSSQVSPMEQAKAQAQRRIEKARGKRQRK